MSAQVQGTAGRRGGGFYLGMAIAMAAVVAVGFAPTFYLKPIVASPPLPPLVWLHGLMFTAWILLLVVQAGLVARDRVAVHMRLGIAGAVLAAGMVVVGLMTAINAARLGHVPPGAPPPLVFMAIPFFSICSFAVLVACALALRHRPEAHKRLMLLGTVAMLGAAVARLPLPVPPIPPVFFGVSDLFVLAGMLHDRRTRGRIHPAYWWGGLGLIASQPLQLAFMGTGAWLAFATWLAG
jgi:hypothetical protein